MVRSAVARKLASHCWWSGISSRRFCVPVCRVSDLNQRKRQVLLTAKRCGWPELEVVVGNFAERSMPAFTDSQTELLADILKSRNGDLFRWLNGQVPPPRDLLHNDVFLALLKYVNADHPALAEWNEDGGVG
eukprot:TRINITY_DN80539_c0_g1_i1.p1 TRINITY_DN80539_c0_g1~~TRINITY_DN80539_c0_g1_i1.p1  ORF type:complete len:132 (+),score=17.88 TRINITY_DN80539_c0_g1_i1:89-484(+)